MSKSKTDSAHIIGHLDTRPYMRARYGLAECLWTMKEHDTAISHYYAMLNMNITNHDIARATLSPTTRPVSYTHLTLPTILLV